MGTNLRGYDSQDIDQMKRYANILYELNGGESAIQSFIRKNLDIFNQQENPMACITYLPPHHHTNPDPWG
jgi:hypothetical protein